MSNYQESNQSKKLMELNALYMDQLHSNKPLAKIQRIKEKLGQLKKIAKAFFHIPSYGIKKWILMIRVFFNKKIIQDYELQYDFNHDYELKYVGTGKRVNGHIAVYTSIFGGYDSVLEPMFVSEKCDYYAITDQDIPDNSVWKKMDLSHIPGFNEMDNYHKSKYCKLHPHILFPEYEYSIWADGNVQIVGDMVPLVDRMTDDHVMATFENPVHECIYTEEKFLIYLNAANAKQLGKQIETYKEAGFPKKFGMREFTIIVRKHNDIELCALMDEWWEHVNTYTMRDQISLPFILWSNNKSIDYIQLYPGNWRYNPRFIYSPHKWRHTFK